MQKQEAEANLYRTVLAVCEADGGVGRDVSIQGLVLKGLVGVTDKVLMEALQGLRGLRCGVCRTRTRIILNHLLNEHMAILDNNSVL